MIIYLKYPRKYGFFSWDELSLVARILGFHGDLFRRNFPAFITLQTDGIAVQLLLKLVCDNTYLHTAVDGTANLHFFPWNISAIHKTILLLNERLLTFAEIHLVRVAYLFYDGTEAKGLPLDGNILQKTLKLCGRMISQKELSHRLCHMIPQLQESGFLQLHEFLDLVLWTELYNPQILKKAESLLLVKDGDGCFQMSNFEELLQTVDNRLLITLNTRYKVEECTSKSSRDAWRQDVTESYINPTFRLIRVSKARSDFGNFTKALNQSCFRLKQSKFGYGNRTTTTSPLMKVAQGVHKNSSSKIQMVRAHSHFSQVNMVEQNPSRNQMIDMDSSVVETSKILEKKESTKCQSKSRVLSSKSAPDDASRGRDKTGFPTPNASAFSRYRIPTIVTDEDLQRTSVLIDRLKFDETTLATRSEQLIDTICLQRTKKTAAH